MQATRTKKTLVRGFTLIELLVSISIIGLLIGILLPSLSAAIETSREVVCISNMKQLGTANLLYAVDYNDQTMPVTPFPQGDGSSANWAYTFENGVRVSPGLLIDYVENATDIVECPKNKRRDLAGVSAPSQANGLYYGDGEVNFDYTFVAEAEGARTYNQFETRKLAVHAPNEPRTISLLGRQGVRYQDNLIPFAGHGQLPIIVEESSLWYNNNGVSGNTDGRWGNNDQWTLRHGGGGSTYYLDGRVERFVPPDGYSNEDPEIPSAGFSAHDIFFRLTTREVFYGLNYAGHEYGGINRPHDNPAFN